MNRDASPGELFARLAGPGLARGPVIGPFCGRTVEVWLSDGEPVIAVLADGDPADLEGLARVAWSLGCGSALSVLHGRARLIGTALPSPGPTLPRSPPSHRIDAVPVPVPGVVHALARLAGTWRERLLRQCLAGHHDWTESDLNLAVEAPIAGLLLGTGGGGGGAARMRAELDSAGVVLDAVPPGLLALAWDLHLARGVRLAGADASIGPRPPGDRAGPDRSVLGRFAAWAGRDAADGVGRILVQACGAGRLLLACGDWAAAHNIQLYAVDPDPRAVLFAEALVGREFGDRLACTVRAGHPLVENDLDDDPLARLIPKDARARLRPADWSSLFGGIDRFDRVLIADPALPLTRRSAVQRYVESRYATGSAGTDPALLLIEAGARRLAPGGRVLALFPVGRFRVPSAAAFRRWLAPRTDRLVTISGYSAVRAAADPVTAPLVAGGFRGGVPVVRAYPRSALDSASWTLTDPARAALLTRLEAGGTPLGEVLVGGVGRATPVALDPSLLMGAGVRRLLVRADRRAAGAIRPVLTPEDVVRFGSAGSASLFALVSPLPPRARRLARQLGLEPPETDDLPPPAGPRLLFAEGASIPAFLFDRFGRAIPTPGVGTIAPADHFLLGLLHAAPVAVLIAERCPNGLSTPCLARLPVRLPDPYDERESQAGAEIAALARRRLALTVRDWPGTDAEYQEIEAGIECAVERLYGISSA